MTQPILRFILLFVIALLVGAMFGVWLGFDPAQLSAGAYVEMQQTAIRGMNTAMPILGAVCIVLCVILAVLAKDDPPKRLLLIAAALLLIVAGAVTRFGNQPINAIVMTWNAASPPAEWSALRDRWWHLHLIRTAAGMLALVVVLLAMLRSRPR